ncbi:hypothetical protein EDB81DRAFT_805007 [Dactylonectria macrodidyma]|uniref:Uncharacterized protein n=1 Tax=Dactylonectria macrodidyma TaxID=307937 RepID=A0A9P9EBX1_9HYPO|nr:hypothetical protein EDB81DRAFT_805007 [Dactylonectria macrodidyma]
MSGIQPTLPFMESVATDSASQPGTDLAAATHAGPGYTPHATLTRSLPVPLIIDSDSDSDFDYADDFLEPNNGTLASIAKSQTITLSITSTYSHAWGPVEGFRELVQNWRDGIIASFGLSEDQFKVTREECAELRKIEVLYKVSHPRNPQDCIGYIRFDGRDGQGTISMVNKEATLEPWHLDLGGTTKAGVGNQAGAHGEGLKIALLVLQRGFQNHAVRCVSGGFNWTFAFNTRGKLVARLRRMTSKQLGREKVKSRALLQTSQPSSLKDVCFYIGAKVKGRDQHGNRRDRNPVRLEHFNKWCGAALFLQDAPDDGIVRTARGDLITHERLCGHLYLKGLLLKSSSNGTSASITGRPLKFGYNFSDGATNRERQSMKGAREEGAAILNIWDRVLMEKPNYIIHLHEMLISSDPEYADVLGAKSSMKIDTAIQLKRHLFSDPTKWYYSPSENSRNPRLEKIIQGLDRKGVELPNAYWEVLQKFGLVRTADQEQRRRFLSAEIAIVPQQSYAEEVVRLLRASLRGCAQTSETTVQFVRAGQLSLHTFYVEAEKLFKIHEKWLSREASIQELGLPQHLVEADVLFHVIKRLFSEVLDEVPDDRFDYDENHSNIWHKKRVLSCTEQRLLDYRGINNRLALTAGGTTQTTSRMTLQWDGDLSWGDDSLVTVQLHAELTCSHLRDLLLAKDFDSPVVTCIPASERLDDTIAAQNENEPAFLDIAIPKCHELTCRIGAGSCSFDQLEADVEYFAVMFKPSDLDSIALRSSPCVATRVIPTQQQQLPTTEPAILSRTPIKTVPSTPSRTSQTPGQQNGTTRGKGKVTRTLPGIAPRSDSSRNGDVFPLLEQRSCSSSPAASPSSPQNHDMARETNQDEDMIGRSYAPGRALATLDILEPRDWYEAMNGGSRRVVIGIIKGELDTEGSRQKRQRTEM